MSEIIALVLPFFGVIFIGGLVARLTRQPVEALGWMNFFIIYLALPALFIQLLSRTPLEDLTNWRFIFGAVAATYCVFFLMFAIAWIRTRDLRQTTIQSLAASYGNIGYMGPGIAILAFGPEAAVPVALIFCFENAVHFAMAPFLMAVADRSRQSFSGVAMDVLRKIALHPFIIASAIGVALAWLQFRPPLPLETLIDFFARAAAPCALFAMGVTIALRPLKRAPIELLPITLLKLVIHPAICYAILTAIGGFPPMWIYTAMLLAALPTATNVFVIAQQYGVWIERASASVLVTTIVSIATLTLTLYAIKSGLLPVDPWS
jgi:malonate transporter and related proteins